MKKNFNSILKRSSDKAIDQIMAKLKILKQNIVIIFLFYLFVENYSNYNYLNRTGQ